MSQAEQEHIAPPGTEAEMTPQADHGENSYRGSQKLTDRVAVITGGDSGIGRAVAIAYAREGADILISYLNEQEDEDARETARHVEAAGRRCVLVPVISPRLPIAAPSSTEPSASSVASTSW